MLRVLPYNKLDMESPALCCISCEADFGNILCGREPSPFLQPHSGRLSYREDDERAIVPKPAQCPNMERLCSVLLAY